MRIVAIADTHGHFPKLPAGDVLIHAGDATMMGTVEEFKKFNDWLSTLNFRYILFIPGNHDFLFEKHPDTFLSNATILINKGVVIDGINFWGSPYSPIFGSWAFMKRDNDLAEIWRYIPDKLDVLITHGPPKGTQDLTVGNITVGSQTLLDKIREVKPRIHIFGHIHEGYGKKYNRETLFANVSLVDEYYRNVNKPLEMDLL